MSADLGQAGVILLAGGESRRMGRDKTALPLPGGKTLVQHAVDRCQALGFGQILLSVNASVKAEGADVVADEQTGAGPIMGVLSCLRRAEFNWNLVWPADVPFLPDTVIKDMAAVAASSEADAVALKQNGWVEPLICVLHRRVMPVLDAIVAEGGRKFLILYERVRTRYHPYAGDPEAFLNINGPEDYAKVCRYANRREMK